MSNTKTELESRIRNLDLQKKHNKNNKKNTKAVSYRLPIEIVEQIDERSEYLKLSPSFLVKQTLKKYIAWDVYVSEFDLVTFPKEILHLLINYIPFEKINEVGECMSEFINDCMVFQKREKTWKEFIEIFSKIIESSNIKILYDFDSKNTTIIIRHKMGSRWSIFFEIVFVNYFKNVMEKEVWKTSITQNTCKIIFPTIT